MRILMLGNSFTTANDLPGQLAALTGAEVVCHTRGGARLAEHLNPGTRLGARTQAALAGEHWDHVVLQEMSHGPCTSPGSFFASVERLCAQIRAAGAVPVLYATWAYQEGGAKLAAKSWDYETMARTLSEAYRQAAGRITPCLPRWESSSVSAPALRISTLPTASTPMPWEAGSRLKPWHL